MMQVLFLNVSNHITRYKDAVIFGMGANQFYKIKIKKVRNKAFSFELTLHIDKVEHVLPSHSCQFNPLFEFRHIFVVIDQIQTFDL
jgi:hypothetical protein